MSEMIKCDFRSCSAFAHGSTIDAMFDSGWLLALDVKLNDPRPGYRYRWERFHFCSQAHLEQFAQEELPKLKTGERKFRERRD